MALTKVTETVLLAPTSTAANGATVGSAIDVSTWYMADIRVRMGRGTGTVFTIGPKVRIEGTYDATPNADQWAVLAEFQALVGLNLASQAVSGTEAAGQTTVTLAAGTNFEAGDYVFFHNTTIGNSEWSRVLAVSGADLTLEEGLVNAQTGATCRDQAEQYRAVVDLVGIQKIRVVIDGAGSGQAVVHHVTAGGVTEL